jgi:hypothetical protein
MSVLTFAQGCTFTADANGRIAVAWNNGNALKAVRGAAIDYINPIYHMACTLADNKHTYAPTKDLGRLIAGGVPSKLALLVVGFRKIASTIDGCTLNIAELHTVTAADQDGTINAADFQTLTDNNQAFNAIIDVSATVLGLNGISLMLKGHNYLDADSMWIRLESAVDMEAHTAALGITDYSSALLHDALHPFDADWKVKLASDMGSPLIGHVNGVLVKRMPGVPAGTAIVFVTLAAIREIALMRPASRKALANLQSSLESLVEKIRAAPLQWCAMFQRANTADNLKVVGKLESAAALIYGACTVLFDRKMSIMKAASFKNNAGRHAAMVTLGKSWAENLADVGIDDKAIDAILQAIAADVDSAGDGDSSVDASSVHGDDGGEESD